MGSSEHQWASRSPWAPYAPSNGALASFLCTGVRAWAATSEQDVDCWGTRVGSQWGVDVWSRSDSMIEMIKSSGSKCKGNVDFTLYLPWRLLVIRSRRRNDWLVKKPFWKSLAVASKSYCGSGVLWFLIVIEKKPGFQSEMAVERERERAIAGIIIIRIYPPTI